MTTNTSSFVIYPLPASNFVRVMTVFSFLLTANAGLSEVRGKHLHYSKFLGLGDKESGRQKKVCSSRLGMLILYFPAFLVGLAWLRHLTGNESSRLLWLACAVTVHFFKRILEVLFVHKYSGVMEVESALMISSSYSLFAATSIYNQYLEGVSEPSIDLKRAGVAVFLVGILGNFYHHFLLSKLRKKNNGGYKIPQGGLFRVVICPHYFFEIVGFLGICMISPTFYNISFTLGSALFLTGRSYTTLNWYKTKFPNFPKHVKAIVPFIL